MELIIEGLHKLTLKTFSERKISGITVRNRGRGDADISYVLTFREIPRTPQSYTNAMGTGWESEFEVWLAKFPNQWEKYEMVVMGLHGVTCYELDLNEVRSMDTFTKAMHLVVSRCKGYWVSLK